MATQETATKQSVQGRSNTARNEAMRRLVSAHQDEYNEYILEERRKRGLFGLPGAKPATVREQLSNAQEKLSNAQDQIMRLRKIMEERGIEFDENGAPIVVENI